MWNHDVTDLKSKGGCKVRGKRSVIEMLPHMKVKSYRVFIKYCVFFPRIFESLPPLPRQHSLLLVIQKIGFNFEKIKIPEHPLHSSARRIT